MKNKSTSTQNVLQKNEKVVTMLHYLRFTWPLQSILLFTSF